MFLLCLYEQKHNLCQIIWHNYNDLVEEIIIHWGDWLKGHPVIPIVDLIFHKSSLLEERGWLMDLTVSLFATSFVMICIQADSRSVQISSDLYHKKKKKVASPDAGSITLEVYFQSTAKSSASTE